MAEAAVDLQAEIADDERAARAACRIRDLIVRHFHEVRTKAAFFAEKARQHLRGARGSVESDLGHLFPGHLAHQHNRAHRAAAGNGNAGHHAQFLGRGGVAGNGHESQVCLARGHRGRAARGLGKAQVEAIGADQTLLDPVGDGPRVQKGNRGQAQPLAHLGSPAGEAQARAGSASPSATTL